MRESTIYVHFSERMREWAASGWFSLLIGIDLIINYFAYHKRQQQPNTAEQTK